MKQSECPFSILLGSLPRSTVNSQEGEGLCPLSVCLAVFQVDQVGLVGHVVHVGHVGHVSHVGHVGEVGEVC